MALDQLALDFKADDDAIELPQEPTVIVIEADDQISDAAFAAPAFDHAEEPTVDHRGMMDKALSEDALEDISRRFAPKQNNE